MTFRPVLSCFVSFGFVSFCFPFLWYLASSCLVLSSVCFSCSILFGLFLFCLVWFRARFYLSRLLSCSSAFCPEFPSLVSPARMVDRLLAWFVASLLVCYLACLIACLLPCSLARSLACFVVCSLGANEK